MIDIDLLKFRAYEVCMYSDILMSLVIFQYATAVFFTETQYCL